MFRNTLVFPVQYSVKVVGILDFALLYTVYSRKEYDRKMNVKMVLYRIYWRCRIHYSELCPAVQTSDAVRLVILNSSRNSFCMFSGSWI